MTPTPLQFHLERDPFRNALAMHIFWRDSTSGAVLTARPLTMEEIVQGSIMPATAHITNTSAQQLMDELWRCGLRPTEGSGSAGSLAATERHLKDMQTITMGLLKQHGVTQ